jgi:hypothetical protein
MSTNELLKPATTDQMQNQNTASMKTGYPPYLSERRAVKHRVEPSSSDKTVAGQKSDVSPFVKLDSSVGSINAKPEIMYSCLESALVKRICRQINLLQPVALTPWKG